MEQHASSDLRRKAPLTEERGRRRRELWTEEEDSILFNYILENGIGHWNTVADYLSKSGIRKSAHSCRLRWFNHLAPGIRRGDITDEEKLFIIELRYEWGNKWSKIAEWLPGRTNNEIKNYWNTQIKKEAKQLGHDVYSKEFVQIMKMSLSKGNHGAAGGGGIGGSSAATAPPPLAPVVGGDGNTGTAVAPSATIVDHPDMGAAAPAPPSYFTTIVDHPDLGDLDDLFWSGTHF